MSNYIAQEAKARALRLLTEGHMTQREISQACGISKTTVGRIEAVRQGKSVSQGCADDKATIDICLSCTRAKCPGQCAKIRR